MSRATLTATDALEVGEGAKRFTLDCRHGTTSAVSIAGDGATADRLAVRTALTVHYVRERCACTDELRQRYGLTRTS